jgi:hypothetical protein
VVSSLSPTSEHPGSFYNNHSHLAQLNGAALASNMLQINQPTPGFPGSNRLTGPGAHLSGRHLPIMGEAVCHSGGAAGKII